jgi:small subunit ribosomal protein S4
MKLFLKGSKCDSPNCPVEKRKAYPPASTAARRTKESEYLLQMREKQKCARIYGVLEKQFRSYYAEASRRQGKTGENLLQCSRAVWTTSCTARDSRLTATMARQLVTPRSLHRQRQARSTSRRTGEAQRHHRGQARRRAR